MCVGWSDTPQRGGGGDGVIMEAVERKHSEVQVGYRDDGRSPSVGQRSR